MYTVENDITIPIVNVRVFETIPKTRRYIFMPLEPGYVTHGLNL